MNTLPHGQATTPRLRFIASAAAAIALALFILPTFAYVNVIWDPSYYGEFGFSVNNCDPSAVFAPPVPGSPADKAGIRAGDRVDRPKTLRDRLLLCTQITPHPRERFALSIHRGNQRRTLVLQATPVAPLSAGASALLVLKIAWLALGMAVALMLVLLRPSMMTWGFYLFETNLVLVFGPLPFFLSYIPAGWLFAYSIVDNVIAPAGVVGFLIFCVRFPTNALVEWRKPIEMLAPYLFVFIAGGITYENIAGIQFLPVSQSIYYADLMMVSATFVVGAVVLVLRYPQAVGLERQQLKWIILAFLGAIVLCSRDFFTGTSSFTQWSIFAVFVVGAVVVLVTYFSSHGLERHRIKWVVLGFSCALAATGVDFLWAAFGNVGPWYVNVLELLYVVLPISVAYAVIRHRVIDVRFAASRSLAIGVIGSILAVIVIGIDWLFSTKLPNSRFEAAAYAGVALVVGFSLNVARQKIGRTIDFVFFRPWYRTEQQAVALADVMRRATSTSDLHEPLTAGIANVFSLASVALLEREEDGGFIRVAARGWPAGTIWHLLPDDPLVARAGDSTRVVDIDALLWQEHDLPAGVAHPMIMIPIFAGRRVRAMLLCGAHENGTGLAPDEIRTIRQLCADASLLYARSATEESGQTAYLDQHAEPLRA